MKWSPIPSPLRSRVDTHSQHAIKMGPLHRTVEGFIGGRHGTIDVVQLEFLEILLLLV